MFLLYYILLMNCNVSRKTWAMWRRLMVKRRTYVTNQTIYIITSQFRNSMKPQSLISRKPPSPTILSYHGKISCMRPWEPSTTRLFIVFLGGESKYKKEQKDHMSGTFLAFYLSSINSRPGRTTGRNIVGLFK